MDAYTAVMGKDDVFPDVVEWSVVDSDVSGA